MKDQMLDVESLSSVSGGITDDEYSKIKEEYDAYSDELFKKYGVKTVVELMDHMTPEEDKKFFYLYNIANHIGEL